MSFRRAVILTIVATLALAACGGSGKKKGVSAQPAAPGTAWNKVLSQVGPNGEVSKDTALQAFALAFGGMPGVTTPSGAPGTGVDPSEALRWTLGHYNELTPEQRATVDKVLAGQPTGGPGKSRRADGPNTAKYRTLVDAALAEYTPLIGALPFPTEIQVTGAYGQAYAYVFARNASKGLTGTPVSCQVNITPMGAKAGDAFLSVILKHEVFHCYQAAWIGSLDQFYNTVGAASWVIEGSATWAELNLGSSKIDDDENWWYQYLGHPTRQLFARTYDAVGFYGQVAQFIDLWANLKAFIQGSGNESRYGLLAGKAGDPFLDSWGPGFYRSPYLGKPWTISSQHVPSAKDFSAPFDNPKVANGTVVPVKAAPYALSLVAFQPTSDVVHVAINGHARFSDKSGVDTTELADAYFCSQKGGSCPCPASADGTPPPLKATPVKGYLSLGITGATGGANGTVEGLSLDEFCKRKPKKAGPCGLLDQQVIKQATGLDTKPGAEIQISGGLACTWATDITVPSPFAGLPSGGPLPGPTTKASVSLLVRDPDNGGEEETSDVSNNPPTPLNIQGAGQSVTASTNEGGSQATAIVVGMPKGQPKVIVMFVFGATPGVSGATLLAQTATNRF